MFTNCVYEVNVFIPREDAYCDSIFHFDRMTDVLSFVEVCGKAIGIKRIDISIDFDEPVEVIKDEVH